MTPHKSQRAPLRSPCPPTTRCSLPPLPLPHLCPLRLLVSIFSSHFSTSLFLSGLSLCFSLPLSLALSHTHAPLLFDHGDGRFRCDAQADQGHCHRQFSLHQLSPSTLKTLTSSCMGCAKANKFKLT